MKPIHRILATVFVLVFAAPASAVTFQDIDSLGGVRLSAGGTSMFADAFDLTADGIEGDAFWIGLPYTLLPRLEQDSGGFVVGTHSAVDASFEIYVRDDFDPFRAERLVVELGGSERSGPIEVDFGIESIGVSATLLATIDGAGRLAYTITATQGDFFVDFVSLSIEALEGDGASPPSAPPIPEVGSLSAYGVGTLLVAFVARRRRA